MRVAIEAAEANGHTIAFDHIDRIARAAREHGAILASHDDAPEKVELVARYGARISEFVINADSAHRAREIGLHVCMGAPNIVRGRSSGGNLCAAETVKLGLMDALCSDYHPPSMLQAAFKLVKEKLLSLSAAADLVSYGPVRAASLADRGEIREGKVADLIIVGERVSLPVVTHTTVGGAVAATSGEARITGASGP